MILIFYHFQVKTTHGTEYRISADRSCLFLVRYQVSRLT